MCGNAVLRGGVAKSSTKRYLTSVNVLFNNVYTHKNAFVVFVRCDFWRDNSLLYSLVVSVALANNVCALFGFSG